MKKSKLALLTRIRTLKLLPQTPKIKKKIQKLQQLIDE